MKLSIIVPAFNEGKRIGRMLDAYMPFFSERYEHDFEMIIVINGSSDGTVGVVASYAKRWPQIRFIVESRKIGKGGALMLGFADASGEMIGFVDADGSTPPDAFAGLIGGIGDAGAIIASRWLKGSDVKPRQPLSRRVASRAFNLIVRILFGLRISDTQCGAKLITGEAVKRVLPRLGITRWAFDVDLLFQLRREGFMIKEMPTAWHDVAGSRVKIIRASAEMVAALTRLRLLYSPFKFVVVLYDSTLGWLIHRK